MATINEYIVNGELTDKCMLSRELMNKCSVSLSQQTPIRANDNEVEADKKDPTPSSNKQYYQKFLEFAYPGAGKNNGIIIPNVVVHSELGTYFNKTSVMFGVPQGLTRLLEVSISTAGGTADFKDRRIASDEKHWWTRVSFTDAVEGKEYIRIVSDEEEEFYGSFHDLFRDYPTSMICNVTCSIKLICEVDKGEEPKKGAYWRAALRVSMVTPIDAINIPAPISGTIHKSIAGSKDNIKDGLKKIKRSAA